MSASSNKNTASTAASEEQQPAESKGASAVPDKPTAAKHKRQQAAAAPAPTKAKGTTAKRKSIERNSALFLEDSTLLPSKVVPTLDVLVRNGVPSVFLDANILIPEYLRSVFLDLAYAGLLVPHWSKGVLEETRRNLVDPQGRYALLPKDVDKTLRYMANAFPLALVHGSEKYDAAFSGRTDAKDQHVAAGALKVSKSVYGGKPVVLVTSNAKDLPQWAFKGTQVLMVRPDLFLVTLLKFNAKSAVAAIENMLARFKNPPTKPTDLLNVMVGAGCHQFAFELARHWGFAMERELTPARQRLLGKNAKP